MGNKLTQLAIVIVFGLIILLGTLLVFQAWYNTIAPTDAEIHALAIKATKMDVDAELAELNGPYNTSKSVEMAGRVLMIIEGVVMAFLLIYVLAQPVRETADQRDDSTLRRAYEGY